MLEIAWQMTHGTRHIQHTAHSTQRVMRVTRFVAKCLRFLALGPALGIITLPVAEYRFSESAGTKLAASSKCAGRLVDSLSICMRSVRYLLGTAHAFEARRLVYVAQSITCRLFTQYTHRLVQNTSYFIFPLIDYLESKTRRMGREMYAKDTARALRKRGAASGSHVLRSSLRDIYWRCLVGPMNLAFSAADWKRP